VIRVDVIRTSGREEVHEVPPGIAAIRAIHTLLSRETVDVVNVRDGRLMVVDDEAWESETVVHPGGAIELVARTPRKPINVKATALYRAVTMPNDHQIAVDVAIVFDADLA